jgi:carboxyl-terminal processing protease
MMQQSTWFLRKIRSVGVWLILTCMICIAVKAFACESQIKLPEPTGEYGIGTTIVELEDSSRLEEMSEAPDDYRRIVTQIWYPAAKGATGSRAVYMDTPTIDYLLGVDDMANTVKDIPTHAILSAPPVETETPFPVLIFSPGLGSVVSAYQAIIEDIVSHGYVVAAINHPYISGITVFADGSTAAYDEETGISSVHAIIVEDIKFLADRMEALTIDDTPLPIDADNIGFFGHSIGGSAAVEACLQLPQGKGALDMDGSLFGEQHKQPIMTPTFFILAGEHDPLSDTTVATAWRNIIQEGYFIHMESAAHNSFTDFGLILSQLTGYFNTPEEIEDIKNDLALGDIDPQQAIKITRDYTVRFFDSCLKNKPVERISEIDYPEAQLQVAGDTDAFDGNWRSVGYGYLLQVENGAVRLNQVSKKGMLFTTELQIHNGYLYDDQEQVYGRLSLDGDTCTVTVDSKPYRFERIEDAQLPDQLSATRDPVINFEVFWHTFEENCSLFGLTGVDWKAAYYHYRPRVNADTAGETLFDIFAGMIAPLTDGHTLIYNPDSGQSATSGPSAAPMWTEDTDSFFNTISTYMDDGLLNVLANGLIQYGTIGNTVGYLSIKGFEMNTDESMTSAAQEFYIDEALEALKEMPALIIDTRFNRGGDDQLALALASRLTNKRRIAFSKQVRIGDYDQFNEPTPYYFEPKGNTYIDKPVALLISDATASAAEVFAMAVDQLENVILIGEQTHGHFSDMLVRSLPNGWTFTLSNERYFSWEEINYEQLGITPDIEITGDADMLAGGQDNILEGTLEYLNAAQCDGSRDELPTDYRSSWAWCQHRPHIKP